MRMRTNFARFCTWLFGSAVLASFVILLQGNAQSYEERERLSPNLLLPEEDQFRLGSNLFSEKKYLASWQAFQTFLYNYSGSFLTADAQFMIAEAVFQQAVQELKSGNPPDEVAWRKQKKSGLRKVGKGLKKGIRGLKFIGSTISGEAPPIPEAEQIDFATFSEAIEQYRVVYEKHRKSGLADSALFRMAESYYNMGDYPSALEHFRKLQKEFPQSYLVGEAALGAAQCYLPGGDFGSAELEVKRLLSSFPAYQELPQVKYMLGMVYFQAGKYETAATNLQDLETPEAVYYAGQSLLKSGKSFAATAQFKKLAEEYKEHALSEIGAYLIGDSFLSAKNYSGAIGEFKKFLNNYPQSVLKEGVLFRIGASHFLKKDYPAARESFNLLWNTFPNGEFVPLAKYFTAESYRLAKQLKEASFAYGQLIAQMPQAPIAANARFKLAWITYLQQNYTGAADAFQRYIDLHPFHTWVPHAYLLMGNCYSKTGRSEDAAQAYQQAFDRAPKTELAEAAMALLNRTRYNQGNYGRLSSGFTYILKSLPPSESKWRAASQLYLADSYYRQKLYREAISVFQSIVSLYPNQPAAYQALDGLSWCYFQTGDYELSRKYREQIQELKLPAGVSPPKMTSGSFELANALFNQKKYMEALENYEKFIRESPNSPEVPEAIFRIGLCYYRQEYYTQAIDTWLKLEKDFPKHARTEEAVFQVADTYFRAHKYDQAVETYRRILVQYPKSKRIPEATLRIGQSYYNAGNDEKATSELEAFLRKFPEDAKANETLDLLEASLDRRESSGGDAVKQKGIALLKGLTDAFPRSALAQECQFRIARRYFLWKDYANAAKEFETLTNLYPDSSHIAESQFFVAEAYYFLKKFPEAILVFQRFLKNFPQSEYAAASLFHLAQSFFYTEKYAEAIDSYQKLLSQFSDTEFASAGLYNLALSQRKLQRLPEAADSYMKLALSYPNDPNAKDAILEVAKIRQELKQHSEAIMVLRDLDAKIPSGEEKKLEIASLLAENYIAIPDPEEAIEILRKARTWPPANSPWKLEILRILGSVYESQGAIEKAIEVYSDPAARANPSFKKRAESLRQQLRESAPQKHQKTTSGGKQ